MLLHRVDVGGRAADIDVASFDVGHDLAQMLHGQEAAPFARCVIADDVAKPEAPRRGQRVKLVLEDEVARGNRAVEHDDVSVQLL